MSHLRKNATALAAAAALATMANSALAQRVDFSGYGTLAATDNTSDLGDYRANWRQSAGANNGIDVGVDSRLGAQANVTFNDTFSAAAQALAIRRDGDKFKLNAEWLYGQAQVTSELSVRAGRLVLPTFMLSDVRNVGYAQHWVRTPAEVYLGFPVTSIDGAQVLYRTDVGGVRLTVQPTYGQAKATVFFDGGMLGELQGGAKWDDLWSLNVSAEKGDWTFRAGETTSKSSLVYENAPFIPTSRFTDKFTSLGAQYDNGALLVMAEFVDRETSSKEFDTRAWYSSAGYRIGSWMPYVSVARLTNLGTTVKSNPASRTIAGGLRWDVVKNVDLKLQIESSTLSGQQFVKLQPTADKSKNVNIVTLASDFVF